MRERNKGQTSRSAAAIHLTAFPADRDGLAETYAVDQEVTGETASRYVKRGQQALLFRMLNALSAETDLGNFLGQVVVAVAEQLAAHSAYLCLYCEKQKVLRLEGWYVREDLATPSPKPNHVRLPRTATTGPLWRELLRVPKPMLVPNAVKDQRVPFRDLLLSDGLNNLLLVPLLTRKKALGLIGIMGPGLESYEPKEIALAEALGQQTVIALHLSRLVENAKHAAVLQERSRVARDLHDTMAQGITGILIQMNLAENTLVQNQHEALGHIKRATQLGRQCMLEARRLVSALQPRCLKEHCLASALQQLAAELTSGTAVQVEFSVQCAASDLFPEMEAELFHIGQEALTNVLKHAGASKVRVELWSDTQMVRLSIQDDGSGFDHSATTSTHGFGIAGMRERARQIGGKLEIRSQPGSGTQILVVVPPGKRMAC